MTRPATATWSTSTSAAASMTCRWSAILADFAEIYGYDIDGRPTVDRDERLRDRPATTACRLAGSWRWPRQSRASTMRASRARRARSRSCTARSARPAATATPRRRQAGPQHVGRRAGRRPRRVEVPAAVDEGDEPAELGRLAELMDEGAVVQRRRPSRHRRPAAARTPAWRAGPAGGRRRPRRRAAARPSPSRGGRRRRRGSARRRRRRRRRSPSPAGRRRPIPGSDTTSSSIDATAAALEDVDGRDVAVHGADAAGDLAEGAGPIGQPDPDDQRARRVVVARRADRSWPGP